MIYFALMIFGIIAVSYVIITYTSYVVGNDYIVLNLYNASQELNSSAQFQAAYDQVATNYQSIDLSFIDRMFGFGYLVLVIASFTMAYQARGTNYFGFLSMLTYGLMFVLFVAGLFGTFIEYLYNDILLQMFINMAVNTPLLGYYVTNYGWIFLLHSAALLLVTVIDLDFAFRKNRKEKELAAMDDEII